MVVVSNTSPLSNLAIIGQLDLVREQFPKVLIPPAVLAELGRCPHVPARVVLEAAMAANWVSVSPLNRPVREDFACLVPGEAEALTLATALKAHWMLLDESEAREQAAAMGISFTGALGILRKARLSQRIPSLKEEMRRLRTEARFFISPSLERALLMSVGES